MLNARIQHGGDLKTRKPFVRFYDPQFSIVSEFESNAHEGRTFSLRRFLFQYKPDKLKSAVRRRAGSDGIPYGIDNDNLYTPFVRRVRWKTTTTKAPDFYRTLSCVLKLSYCDVIMGAMASQITSLTVVYSMVNSGADQRKHQSSASLAFVRGIHRWPVNSLHKWPVTRKMLPFDDVIMYGVIRGYIWQKVNIHEDTSTALAEKNVVSPWCCLSPISIKRRTESPSSMTYDSVYIVIHL